MWDGEIGGNHVLIRSRIKSWTFVPGADGLLVNGLCT